MFIFNEQQKIKARLNFAMQNNIITNLWTNRYTSLISANGEDLTQSIGLNINHILADQALNDVYAPNIPNNTCPFFLCFTNFFNTETKCTTNKNISKINIITAFSGALNVTTAFFLNNNKNCQYFIANNGISIFFINLNEDEFQNITKNNFYNTIIEVLNGVLFFKSDKFIKQSAQIVDDISSKQAQITALNILNLLAAENEKHALASTLNKKISLKKKNQHL